ncbi:UMP kinase [Aedoeadaptatus nemausensis]|uniref:Uridylate kinase n=1 Tax=Aedoeadaptatus nemausensis TaxID=2582829 RepID=A0A6V6XZJ3_9FIRM|nr:UMP kinase [Peptoniphilus nemausensis]CAC9924844.1 UMP kinase [Peptoniphilus nemausensis]
MEPRYKRIVLKLSGEAMAGEKGIGIDSSTVRLFAREIKKISEEGVETCIVVGGGNFWRGRDSKDMDRATSDYMGMLGTVMNALALQDALEQMDVVTRVMTAIEMKQVAEPYIRRRAIRHLEKGRVVIFSGGIGNPYFSTDTTAALRAAEIDADVILLAKKGTDGIYDSDPNLNADAVKFESLSYFDILSKNLKIMDSTATSLCMENDIPLIVFGIDQSENIFDAAMGKELGTCVK